MKAKKSTYAGKGAEINASRPNFYDLEYVEGDLKYIDTYLGGEQFSGEEALWKNDIPFWSMNYVGGIFRELFKGSIKSSIKREFLLWTSYISKWTL
jgi:hypothetical protein